MSTKQDRNQLPQWVADMVALESQIEEALEQRREEVKAHAEAGRSVSRFHTTVIGQLEALQARLLSIGGSPSGFSRAAPTRASRASVSGHGPEGAEGVSAVMRGIHIDFSHAAFCYAVLHTRAHRFGDIPTADLAENHRRSYTEAALQIHRLIADVVVWELAKEGQECQCACPSCGLGVCLCWHAHLESPAVGSPAEPAGLLVRSPRANSAADRSGLCEGDIILAADGQELHHYQDLQATVRKHQAGEEIRLRVQRGGGVPLEVSLTRP
jgi:hypothetical protein